MSGKIPADIYRTIPGSSVWRIVNAQGQQTYYGATPCVSTLLEERHSKMGARTPGFHKRLASGVFIPPLPYARSDTSLRNAYYDRNIVYRSYYNGTFTGTITGVEYKQPFKEFWVGDAASRLLDQLATIDRADLMNLATSRIDKNVNVGPFLAQIAMTRRMVLKALKGLFTFSAHVLDLLTRKGLVRTVRDIVDEAVKLADHGRARGLSDIYLEILYGWRPLVSDLEAIAKQLQRMADNTTHLPPLLRGQAEVTEVATLTDTQVVEAYPGRFSGVTVEWVLTTTGTVAVGARALAYGRPFMPRRTFSFPPLSTAWDVVPFSFVVDWFINVSAMLKALEATFGVTLQGGCLGLSTVVDIKSTLTARTSGAFDGRVTGDRLDSHSVYGEALWASAALSRVPKSPGSRIPDVVKIEALLSHLPEALALIIQKLPQGRLGKRF